MVTMISKARTRGSAGNPERPIGANEIPVSKALNDETGTHLERVLAYYKVVTEREPVMTSH
jgi:hypothetical protein